MCYFMNKTKIASFTPACLLCPISFPFPLRYILCSLSVCMCICDPAPMFLLDQHYYTLTYLSLFHVCVCVLFFRSFHIRFRMLTFCYLAAFNWLLVLWPSTLSHDWQMGSIPLLTSVSDPRNLLTLWAFASTILMLHRSLLDFEVCILSIVFQF